MSTLGIDNSLPTRKTVEYRGGGDGGRYSDGSRVGMFSWKQDPYGRVVLVLILMYINMFATDHQLIKHSPGKFGIKTPKLRDQILKWLPGFDHYFYKGTGKEFDCAKVSGRLGNYYRNNQTKQKCLGYEHPINYPTLHRVNTQIQHYYLLSGRDECFLDSVDIVRELDRLDSTDQILSVWPPVYTD